MMRRAAARRLSDVPGLPCRISNASVSDKLLGDPRPLADAPRTLPDGRGTEHCAAFSTLRRRRHRSVPQA